MCALVPLACHRSSGGNSVAPLVINEIVATAASDPTSTANLKDAGGNVILDENGDPADWVEIYNPGASAVSLAGYTLSDDLDRPRRFRFPVGAVLEPGGFVVVILSGNRARGPMHAGFRLRTDGETVFLYGNNGRRLLDRKGYVGMEPNVSVGRFPDGLGSVDYDVQFVPTPGAPNSPTGVKPPRIQRISILDDADAGGRRGFQPLLDVLTLEIDILEDRELKFLSVQGSTIEECFLGGVPTGGEGAEPDFEFSCARFGVSGVDVCQPFRSESVVEFRQNAAGHTKEVTVRRETLRFDIPRFEDGTVLRLAMEVENDFGRTVRNEPKIVGVPAPTLVINEYQPSNRNTAEFDRFDRDGSPNPATDDDPDWLEIYNYGDQAIDIGEFALVGLNRFRALRSDAPPRVCDFYRPCGSQATDCINVWRFRDGFEAIASQNSLIAPGEFLLVVADGDCPPFHTYRLRGETKRIFSTDFALERNNQDLVVLLDECGVVVDMVEFDFSRDPEGETIVDRTVGRFPDAAGAKPGVELDTELCDPAGFSPGDNGMILSPGCRLECGTPGEPNLPSCEIAPIFSDIVYTNVRVNSRDRCPRPVDHAEVRAYLNIDRDTGALETPGNPLFRVQMEVEFIDLDSGSVRTELFTRGDGNLLVEEGTILRDSNGDPVLIDDVETQQDPIDNCLVPDRRVAMDLWRVRLEVPPQPNRTLVRFSFLAQDLRFEELRLAGALEDPSLGEPVVFDEANAPQTSFSYVSLSIPAEHPVVINEIFPNNQSHGFGFYSREVLDDPEFDPPEFLELYNQSDEPVELGGMFLSDSLDLDDSPGNPELNFCRGRIDRARKFAIPEGSVIPPKGHWLFLFVDEKSANPDLGENLAARTTLIRSDEGNGRETLTVRSPIRTAFLLAEDERGNCVLDSRAWDVVPPNFPRDCSDGAQRERCLLSPSDDVLAWIPDRDPAVNAEFQRSDRPTPGESNCTPSPLELVQVQHFLVSSDPMRCPFVLFGITIRALLIMSASEFTAHANPVDALDIDFQIEEGVTFVAPRVFRSSLDPELPQPGDCQVVVAVDFLLSGSGGAALDGVVDYSIRVTDSRGISVESGPLSLGVGSKPTLTINEIQSRNTRTISAPSGEFLPWIELHNASDETVDFAGMFLTNNSALPRRWMIPNLPETTIAPGGFLLIFASGSGVDDDPGDLVAPFEIPTSAAGELFLLDSIARGHCIVDDLSFDFTGTGNDVSIGPHPDGTGSPGTLPCASPLDSNVCGAALVPLQKFEGGEDHPSADEPK